MPSKPCGKDAVKPGPTGLLAFFSPQPAPIPPTAAEYSAASKKRKRKSPRAAAPPAQAVIELLDSDSDDEIQFVDAPPAPVAVKERKKRRVSSPEDVAPRPGERSTPVLEQVECTVGETSRGSGEETGVVVTDGELEPDDRDVRVTRIMLADDFLDDGLSVSASDQWADDETRQDREIEESWIEGGDEVEGGDWTEESMRTDVGDDSLDFRETATHEEEEKQSQFEKEADDQPHIVQGSSKDLVDLQSPSGSPPKCPVCDKDLSSFQATKRDVHVGNCLDGISSNGSKPSTSFNFFRPLSSLFRARTSTLTPLTAVASNSTSKASSKVKGKGKAVAPSPSSTKLVQMLSSHPVPLPSPSAPSTAPIMPNAFTTLMLGNAETKQWKEAEEIEKVRGRLPKGEKRGVPFYKWVEGLEITVDAFKYGEIEGCKGYFLSHAHSDHYQNLSASWDHGPIYCSATTANLIKLKLNVKDEWINILPMNQTVVVQGISVTLIDANHCPGSVLFLFEGPHTDPTSPFSRNPKIVKRYLHCGDFRASPEHINHPAIVGKKIDIVYLDTTYLDHKYCFPAQELVINACAELIRSRVVDGADVSGAGKEGDGEVLKGWLGKGKGTGKEKEKAEDGSEPEESKPTISERVLVLVGTYSIGKERIVKGIARTLGTRIYCDDRKLAILQAQDDPELHALVTRDPLEAQVHIVYLQDIQRDSLMDYLDKYRNVENGFTKVIGLRPTGWTYRPEGQQDVPGVARILERESSRKTFSASNLYPQRDSTSLCLAYGVPYSEHSSFYELTCFALSLNYVRIIPTVNCGSELSRKKMQMWIEKWRSEKKRRADARLPRMVPHRAPSYW